MRYTIRRATVLDIYCIASVGSKNKESAPDEDLRERLITAWDLSHRVWLAVDRSGIPGGLFGVAPKEDAPEIGVIWMYFLASFDQSQSHNVLRLVADEMLQAYDQLENFVNAEKTWALELMRTAGFEVDVASRNVSGLPHHRVWIDRHTLPIISH